MDNSHFDLGFFMIAEAAAAFAVAQGAVAAIKKAVALGKDISGLVGEFGKFFDAKDVIQKAANDKGKKGQSDTAKALELVMQAEQLRQAEDELKHLLLYGYGQPGLWEQLLMERNKIRQERDRAERERKRIAAQRMDWALGIAAVVAMVGSAAGLLWFIVAVMAA